MLWWTLRKVKSKDLTTRIAAVCELAKLREMGHLSNALRDSDQHLVGREFASQLQRAIFMELEKIGAWVALVEALQISSILDKRPIYSALSKFGRERRVQEALASELKAKDLPHDAVDLIGRAMSAAGSDSVPSIESLLSNESAAVRQRAVKVLTNVGHPSTAKPLISSLKDNDRGVRKMAAKALGELGDGQAIEPLRELLQVFDCYDDGEVRKAATHALAKLRAPEVLPDICHMLNWGQVNVPEVEAALAAFGPKAVPFVIEVLGRGHCSYDGAKLGLRFLKQHGDGRIAAPLLAFARIDAWNAKQAIEVLETILGGDGGRVPPDVLREIENVQLMQAHSAYGENIDLEPADCSRLRKIATQIIKRSSRA